MNQEVTRITRMLRNIYEGEAWHGPSIQQVLTDITPQQALLALTGSHNIVELIWHMTAWRNFVIRKLQGEDGYELSGDENFKDITNITDEAWASAKQALEESQHRLVSLLSQENDDKLKKKVGNRAYDYYTLLHGMMQHDVYHLGQIVLLRKHRQ